MSVFDKCRLNITLLVAFAFTFCAAGCDRMMTPHSTQVVKDADAKAAQGEYVTAIALYRERLGWDFGDR